MNKRSVTENDFFRSNCIFNAIRTFALMLLFWGTLAAPSLSRGAELKPDTLVHWDAYVDAARPALGPETPFLWVDQKPERLQRVRDGEILVSPTGKETPKPVSSGLIHDWMGAAFLPGTRVDEVLSAVRDYGSYKDYYKPTVVDSKLLSRSGSCENYSMRVVNKEVVGQTALDMEYETCYVKLDETRWYSITHTTRVQELRHYGQPDEQKLLPDQGTGYVWRLYSIAKFQQRDGGTYVEVEAIALSRDIPAALRWMVNPIVRRVSKNSMLISLQQTADAVRRTEAVSRTSKSPTTADNHSRVAVASEMGTTKGFVVSGNR